MSDMSDAKTVRFTLDGKEVEALPGESIFQAARRAGTDIPHLCYSDHLRPDGNCRACVVEVDGERTLTASCCRMPTEGMKVASQSERARRSQKMVLELLMSDAPAEVQSRDSQLKQWADALEVTAPRFPMRHQPAEDLSHPAMRVALDACIQCTRCLRACREEQVNDVIGYARRGSHAHIIFDMDDPMGNSSCVACGECVQACPTGALLPAKGLDVEADRKVDSVCPYCGVGCQLTYHVKDEQIIRVEGRDGPANLSRLCVKGRFGYDYITHDNRITYPMIRKPGVPKGLDGFDPSNPDATFRRATWEEALDVAAGGLADFRDRLGGNALAGFGSAKGSNEEAYLFQKLVRTGFRTNNVDHCTRLCHASSVMALLEGVGSGAVSNPVADVADAEVIVIVGANPPANHPVAASFIKNAVKEGKKLVLIDPRRTELARHATHFLQFKPGSDVALFNSLIHTVIENGWVDEAFINERTTEYEALKAQVQHASPEAMSEICGIDPATLREVARLYATSKGAMILWGMGVSQHVHGTDNVRCLIALSLITGQIGRPGTGLHPLRGQNNVQGASDAGLIPMVFPDYQRVDSDQARARFETLWNTTLDGKPGLTVVEIMDAVLAGDIRGMYIMGENPAMSDPNLEHARAAMASLDHLVVQDIFLTETAAFADVVLPASAFPEKTGSFTNTDRRVQIGRAAVPLPGEARQDLWIIEQMASRLGLDWKYADVGEVYEEMRTAMPSIQGITWARLNREDSVIYPCATEDDPGQPVIFHDRFPTESGKARLVPTSVIPPAETPDADYPMVLMTGRVLEHWHTGSMTRRASVLNAIEPEPIVMLHPQVLDALGIQPGDWVAMNSRRGQLKARARADRGMRPTEAFMPFCFREAAANLLTNDALDPVGKIPEFKFCAIRIEAGEPAKAVSPLPA